MVLLPAIVSFRVPLFRRIPVSCFLPGFGFGVGFTSLAVFVDFGFLPFFRLFDFESGPFLLYNTGELFREAGNPYFPHGSLAVILTIFWEVAAGLVNLPWP